MAGRLPEGRVVVFDDDYYYMASTIAELCRNSGNEVCLVTTESKVSIWTENTLEQEKIQSRLLDLGVEIIVSSRIFQVAAGKLTIASVYSDSHQQQLKFDTLIMVTSRESDDGLFQSLQEHEHRFKTLRAIGDCHAPGTVAAAVYDGHSAARYLESEQDIYAPLFRREMTALD